MTASSDPHTEATSGTPTGARPVSAGGRAGKKKHQGMDHLCKVAMERDHGRLLGMIFTPALCDRLRLPVGTPQLLEVLPTELAGRRLQADYLIKIDLGGQVLLVHLEFQNRPDPTMGERVLQYQVAACLRHRLPVYSIVFNVHARDEQPVRVRELCYGSLRTEWIEVTVPAAARAWGPAAASPLAVLLAALMGELSDEELGRCLARLGELGLDESSCRELVEALCFLLDIQQKKDHGATQKRFFMKLRMQETWLYREGKQEGMEKGKLAGKQEGKLEGKQEGVADSLEVVWAERFGAVPPEVTQRIRAIQEPGPLQKLLLAVLKAADVREALSQVLALQA